MARPALGCTAGKRMSITYLEAIREAQARALAEDPRVFIYGQDVGAFGGAFKATKNLAMEFPGGCSTRRSAKMPWSAWRSARRLKACGRSSRCSLPIFRRSGSTRSSIRPPRFSGGRMSHARLRFGCLPGGTSGSGPFHSQSMEAIYAHYPGLIVMTPATVEDAYSMLLEAVAIDDPVIFCEHKFLYYHLKADACRPRPCPWAKRASRAKAAI